MFTGIVETTGKVVSLTENKAAWLLKLEVPASIADSMEPGSSIACNGCCLSMVSREGSVLGFELLEETMRLTSFYGIQKGALVNLERPLSVGAFLGGHFVSGHVDYRSEVLDFERRGKNFYMRVAIPDKFAKYVVYKGSIAIDGISLTVAETYKDSLSVWLIPHTLDVTNLSDCRRGKHVNLEFDLLAKYLEKMTTGCREKSPYQP